MWRREGGFIHLGMKDLPCIPESIERLPQRRVGVEGVWVTMAMGERKRDVEEDNGVVNRYSRVNLRAEERHQGHIVVLLSWWEDYFVIFLHLGCVLFFSACCETTLCSSPDWSSTRKVVCSICQKYGRECHAAKQHAGKKRCNRRRVTN